MRGGGRGSRGDQGDNLIHKSVERDEARDPAEKLLLKVSVLSVKFKVRQQPELMANCP